MKLVDNTDFGPIFTELARLLFNIVLLLLDYKLINNLQVEGSKEFTDMLIWVIE